MKNDNSYKRKKLRKEITDHLKESNIYEKTDDILIDKLVFNILLCDNAQEDIADKGLMVNIARPENAPYYQQNPSIGIFNSACKLIISLSTKLGLDATSRKNLQIDKGEDASLDDLLN